MVFYLKNCSRWAAKSWKCKKKKKLDGFLFDETLMEMRGEKIAQEEGLENGLMSLNLSSVFYERECFL